jgi:hypothetical protein
VALRKVWYLTAKLVTIPAKCSSKTKPLSVLSGVFAGSACRGVV